MMKFRLVCLMVPLLLCAASCNAKVREYKVKVLEEFSHDVSAYTQGLSFDGDRFIETTGQFGESSIRLVDLKSGKVLRKLDFAKKYFAEGSVVLDGKLFILTWLNKVAFVYDAQTLEYEKTYSYPREGWGLTTDGKRLIASDGSSRLYFLDKDFKTVGSVDVMMDGRPVKYLNELEWIDGKVWANVYMTDMIVVIDPSDGKVESVIDCSGLLPKKLRTTKTDVLNGIARDPADGSIYLTGKYWPRLYKIELVK